MSFFLYENEVISLVSAEGGGTGKGDPFVRHL